MDHGSGNTLNSAAAAPFDLDLDSNRLPSTIASLVNFVIVYNLALNCCCYRVAKNTRFISVTFTLEQLTNQVGYIIVIARVARDLWQRKQTLSSGCALGLGWFTAINPRTRAITITYALIIRKVM